MMQRKTNPEISGILSLLLNRFDRLEKQIASVGRDNLGGDGLAGYSHTDQDVRPDDPAPPQ